MVSLNGQNKFFALFFSTKWRNFFVLHFIRVFRWSRQRNWLAAAAAAAAVCPAQDVVRVQTLLSNINISVVRLATFFRRGCLSYIWILEKRSRPFRFVTDTWTPASSYAVHSVFYLCSLHIPEYFALCTYSIFLVFIAYTRITGARCHLFRGMMACRCHASSRFPTYRGWRWTGSTSRVHQQRAYSSPAKPS